MKYSHFLAVALLVIFPFLEGCKTSKKNNSLSSEDINNIVINQNGVKKMISSETSTIFLKRDEFSIRFLNKIYNPETQEFHATQIAALLNKDEFAKVEPGMNKEDISFFIPGSGMAPSVSGEYELLIFNNDGHHYLFYENEDSKRLNLLEDYGEYKKLEFNITTLLLENEEIKMKNVTLEKFYLVVFMDRNNNQIIDTEELYKIIIQFK